LLWAKLFGRRQPGTGRTIAAGARYGSRPRRGFQQLIVPGCRPGGSHSAASPGHARRWRFWRFPSRPGSRTDERARCPPWFSAVPAVSDRTGCSAASNWGKDPRRTVRPAQRSVTPRSARSCRRAGTVTADGMALPREQCVGADGEAPGRSPAESYFRAPPDWWSAFTALGPSRRGHGHPGSTWFCRPPAAHSFMLDAYCSARRIANRAQALVPALW
jgi:hypothetical protein